MEHLESSACSQTFHLFLELPNELKDMIWEHIISAPRVTELITEACPWELDFFANFATRTRKVMFIQPPSPLLFVCKSSREYALKNSDMMEFSREMCSRRDPPPQETVPGLPVWGTQWKVGIFPNYSQSFYTGFNGYDDKLVTPSENYKVRLAMKNVIFSATFYDIRIAIDALGSEFAKCIRTITMTDACWNDLLDWWGASQHLSNSHLHPRVRDLHTFLQLSGLKEIIFTGDPEMIKQGVEKAKKQHPEWKMPHWWVLKSGTSLSREPGERALEEEYAQLTFSCV